MNNTWAGDYDREWAWLNKMWEHRQLINSVEGLIETGDWHYKWWDIDWYDQSTVAITDIDRVFLHLMNRGGNWRYKG